MQHGLVSVFCDCESKADEEPHLGCSCAECFRQHLSLMLFGLMAIQMLLQLTRIGQQGARSKHLKHVCHHCYQGPDGSISNSKSTVQQSNTGPGLKYPTTQYPDTRPADIPGPFMSYLWVLQAARKRPALTDLLSHPWLQSGCANTLTGPLPTPASAQGGTATAPHSSPVMATPQASLALTQESGSLTLLQSAFQRVEVNTLCLDDATNSACCHGTLFFCMIVLLH